MEAEKGLPEDKISNKQKEFLISKQEAEKRELYKRPQEKLIRYSQEEIKYRQLINDIAKDKMIDIEEEAIFIFSERLKEEREKLKNYFYSYTDILLDSNIEKFIRITLDNAKIAGYKQVTSPVISSLFASPCEKLRLTAESDPLSADTEIELQNNDKRYIGETITKVAVDPGGTYKLYFKKKGYKSNSETYVHQDAYKCEDIVQTSLNPAAPNNLVAKIKKKNKAELSWIDNSSNEDGFNIERSSSKKNEFIKINNVNCNVTSYIDIGLEQGITYYYRVRAYENNKFSEYSNTAQLTIKKGKVT